MLLDGETFDLVQHIDTGAAGDLGHELEPRINAELMQSVLEIATPVCRNAGDVQRELLKLRAYVSEVGREKGMRVGSAGRTPSASSSASGSRRATATATSSTSSSTSRGAS
jgi:gamma-glutamyl:cysteine ligase YbdK (ATP-grasp superfamily)